MHEQLLNRPCGGRFGDIVESIGNTPLVELPRLSPKPDVRIYAKLEGHNPTGSVKDRVAKSMIEKAEAEGAIEPGQTILEPTSGNTGIALAMICRRKGYPLQGGDARQRDRGAHPAAAHVRRRDRLLRGRQGLQRRGRGGARAGQQDPSFFMPYQYGNEANPLAHYNGTAVEILEELDEVAAFVGGLGTGGTLMGNGRRLKEADPETLIVAAEPMQGELVQGLRSLDDGFIPPIIDLSLLDRKIMVSNRDAIVWTKSCSTRRASSPASPPARSPRRRPHRRRARLRQRRLPDPRRRLEVPLLRRLHEAARGDREPRFHRLVVATALPLASRR